MMKQHFPQGSCIKFPSFPQKNPIEEIWENPAFSWNIPVSLIHKIQTYDFSDPIFAQFVPSIKEKIKDKNFSTDPLNEKTFMHGQLIHKYHNRALLLCTKTCAMHCRFCFRKNMSFSPCNNSHFSHELNYIENNESLSEIILSGGDPLTLKDDIFKNLLDNLSSIAHIKTIRIHTRMPIGFPNRISQQFLETLRACKKQLFFILHTNHVQELDNEIFNALKKIQMLGIPLLTQSVLLKGINHSFLDLKNLYSLLIEHGIIPYYLHQLDKAEGTKHFAVSINDGTKIMKKLSEELPGYAVPKYVQDICGKKNKTILC